MERTGTITAVSGDTLEVTFCRPGDCEKCHACIGGEKKHVLLVKGEGHVGDVAVVSLPEQTVVKASALAYLLPLAGLFIGMLLGALIAPQSETAGSAIGGVIGLAAALIGLTKALAKELGPSHIRVNCIAPGVINTDMVQVLGRETLDMLADEIPLRKLGRPEDIAEAMLFLAKSEYTTGQVISVDGGFII